VLEVEALADGVDLGDLVTHGGGRAGGCVCVGGVEERRWTVQKWYARLMQCKKN
jgi:hypothetical protein